MSFFINQGSESRLSSAIAMMAAKGCSLGGCTADADYASFKKDSKYDHYMRAHRVKVGKMQAVSPPGFGGTVRHMQEDHPGISNPHALAWYEYEKGDKSHKAAPKGTGAKHVSEKVAKKRSKALKSSGIHSPERPRPKSVQAGPLTPTTTTKESNDVMEEEPSESGAGKKIKADMKVGPNRNMMQQQFEHGVRAKRR